MRTRIVNGVEVIECPHCSGTGTCGNARPRDLIRNGREYVWECSTCGSGLPGKRALLLPFDDVKGTQPTCRVCGGKGFH
jgi:hypothetical protein